MLKESAQVERSFLDEEIEGIRQHLAVRGVHLRAGKNLADLSEHIRTSEERYPLHEQFCPSGDMDGATDAFWVAGFDDDGNLLHTQAAALLNLRDSTLASHIQNHTHRYFPKSPNLVRSSILANPGPKARKINGKVAYHGEMWLAEHLRDQTTSSLANRLGLLMVLREWDPNAVFGLMSWSLALKGFNMRIGYTHCEPMLGSWTRADNGQEHQVWLVYMEREDLQFLVGLPALDFARAIQNVLA